MPKYSYEGVAEDGARVKGKIDAKSDKEARRLLRQEGVRAKKISPPSILELDLGEWMVDKGLAKPFGQAELLNFTKQLSIMISSGVPLLSSLEIIYKSERNPSLKKSVKSIASDVAEGSTIADAMRKQTGFSKLYCNLVKAGEAGGVLDKILEKLMIHMEKQEKTKKAIKSAMTYPSIVLVVGIGVITLMMTVVVPMMQSMFQANEQELPGITQFVINTSEFMQENILVMAGAAIVFVGGFLSWIKTPAGKEVFDRGMMKLPIFGMVILKANLAGFSRTLSTMMGSGVPLVDAIEICIETIDHAVMQKDLKVVRKKVIEGKTLVEPLSRIPYFPEMVTQMVRVGEQTGNVDTMLEKVADVFEDEVDGLIGNLTKMIEPFIIVFLGVFVGGILIAMYLPIFQAAG